MSEFGVLVLLFFPLVVLHFTFMLIIGHWLLLVCFVAGYRFSILEDSFCVVTTSNQCLNSLND